MNALGLLRMEQIKMRRRSASNVAFALFVGMTIMVFGMRAYAARVIDNAPPFALPASGGEIHRIIGQFVVFFSFITVVNLTAAEYQWRTSRQNVIDGLSREQFFAAKLLLVPIISLLFFVVGYGIAVAIAATGGVSGGIASVPVMKAIAGGILTAIGFSSMALLAAFATRHTGGAIALVFGYMVFGENILTLLLRRGNESVGQAAAYLPGNVFGSLSSIGQYSTELQMPQMFGPFERVPTAGLVIAAIFYIVLFSAAGYAVVRRQDL